MRLVVTFGYQKVLFPKGCDYSTVIDAVACAQMVEESGPYDARVFTPSSQSEIDVKLVNDDDVRLPDSVRPESLEKIIELADGTRHAEVQGVQPREEVEGFRGARGAVRE